MKERKYSNTTARKYSKEREKPDVHRLLEKSFLLNLFPAVCEKKITNRQPCLSE